MIKLPGSGPEPQASHPHRRSRLLAKSGLLLLLATGSCFAAVSAAALAATGGNYASAAATTSGTATAPATNLSPTPAITASPAATPSPDPSVTPIGDAPPPAVTAAPTDPTAAPVKPTAKPAAVRPATSPARNSLDIPGLHIDAPIGVTTCGGLIPNGIWQWPCAGRNNLYLLGHAWGVFKPLHDGYHTGLLTPGMAATYSDRSGVAHRYKLLWVEHLTVADWGKGAAWAATSGPVITLQTCDGATDGYRIIARFVPA